MHWLWGTHYSNVIMSGMASQITGIWTVRLAVCSGAHRRKYQSSASLAFARGIHRWPVDSPHKGPVTWNTFLFDDLIMNASQPMHWLWDSDHIFATSCFANLVWKIIEEYSIKISITARADTPTTESVYLKHTPTLVSLGTGGISENICSQLHAPRQDWWYHHLYRTWHYMQIFRNHQMFRCLFAITMLTWLGSLSWYGY